MYAGLARLQATQARDQFREIGGPGGLESQSFLRRRVLEAEQIRVERLTREFPHCGVCRFLLR